MNNIVIGVEGLVGSGKTSLCRELLKMIPNSIILHGGNLYRGIVFALMNSGMNPTQMKESHNIDIRKVMEMLKVSIKIVNNESVVFVDGVEINEEKLQSDKTSMSVSKIAKEADNTKLYSFAKTLIDNYKKQYNVIVSGRDLMKIYPELDYHFFITADVETRVERKMSQYKGTEISKEELKKHIEERDKLQEETGYYKIYENTIKVDVTECKNAKESAEKVLSFIKM